MANLIVYSSSCMTCGQNAMYMARLAALYGSQNIRLVDTRVEQELRPEHTRIMQELSIPLDKYVPVVDMYDEGCDTHTYCPLNTI